MGCLRLPLIAVAGTLFPAEPPDVAIFAGVALIVVGDVRNGRGEGDGGVVRHQGAQPSILRKYVQASASLRGCRRSTTIRAWS